jgi:hypothetical protein
LEKKKARQREREEAKARAAEEKAKRESVVKTNPFSVRIWLLGIMFNLNGCR